MLQTLHVIMNHQYLDPCRLPGKVAVVFDVLLATTTIAMALHSGAREVFTVPEVDDATRLANEFSDNKTILAGEKDAQIPPGFKTFQPSILANHSWSGQRLVLVSTNGTVALHSSRKALDIFTCALVNISAVCEQILSHHPDQTILLVCSASRTRFNVEDFLGTGMLVEQLCRQAPDRFHLTDTALAAKHLAETANPGKLMQQSRVGKLLESLNMTDDLHLAGRIDHFNVAPKMVAGRLVDAARI